MTIVTFRVLEGADRGRVFENLSTPITIGREEGNTIQLNDERISRFHVKIQEDHDKLILTDLESTNGTKVNGEDIKLRILRFGDIVSVGRSLLLFGNRDQIVQRLADVKGMLQSGTLAPEDLPHGSGGSLEFDVGWGDNADLQSALHMLPPPELPESLTPGQTAQLFEVIEFVHLRLRDLIETVRMSENEERVTLELRPWHNLLDLQARMASYLRAIGQGGDEE